MTSVEFYDAKTGAWLTLPRFQIVGFFRLYRVRRSQHFSDNQPLFSLQKGRRGHAMTVTKGKLVVAGGEGVARLKIF